MKSTKIIKLFLLLSIFFIGSINAMENIAIPVGFGHSTGKGISSFLSSIQSKITLKKGLYCLGGALVVGGIIAYFWSKYKARQERIEEKRQEKERLKEEEKERETEKKRERLENERKKRDNECLERKHQEIKILEFEDSENKRLDKEFKSLWRKESINPTILRLL